MADVSIRELTFGYDADNVFTELSINFDTDWKLGLVGRNGRGKTTLLRLLAGELIGTGTISSPIPFDYFPQPLDTSAMTLTAVREAVAPFAHWETEMERLAREADEESMRRYGEIQSLYELHGGYGIDSAIEKELGKLDVDPSILGRPVSSLSGGERTKLVLAALFLKPRRFMLIDEPTNHLDIAGRRTVAAYLAAKRGFLMVSHDRRFLDASVDHIMALEKTGVIVEKGGYSSYAHNKGLRDAFEIEKNEKLEKEIAALEESQRTKRQWSDRVEDTKIGTHVADRGRVGHLAAKAMKRAMSIQTRQQRAIEEKKELLQDLEYASALKITTLAHHKKLLVAANDLSLGYDRPLFHGLSFALCQGDRIVVSGRNGSGKSTLLRAVLGQIEPLSGTLSLAPNLVISSVAQETSSLSGDVKAFAQERGVDLSMFLMLLRKLDFPRREFDRDIARMSGGQKKKLLIAASLCTPAHLYVWDEPLNFVDVQSREQIEELLLTFRPTLLFVEHDEAFLDRISTGRIHL